LVRRLIRLQVRAVIRQAQEGRWRYRRRRARGCHAVGRRRYAGRRRSVGSWLAAEVKAAEAMAVAAGSMEVVIEAKGAAVTVAANEQRMRRRRRRRRLWFLTLVIHVTIA
jgi:hypothetical protein